jgi:protein TonB
MFESVAPETFVPRSRKVLYESLPMSIAAHAVVGAVVLVVSTWNVQFPTNSPRLNMLYQLALEPTPPPPPPSRPAAAPAQKAAPKEKPVAPTEVVAPTIIPDEIPETKDITSVPESVDTDTNSTFEGVVDATGTASSGAATGGIEGTAIGGVEGGMEGGIIGGIPPDTVFVQRHQPLPRSMKPMSMVYPFYPEEARLRGWEDAVTVRYVIGKDGRVKTVTVLEAPNRQIFETTVVKAIRHWRFRPLVKQGVAQEVIHELVVYFKLGQGVG